jgi:DNA methylase N-4/N-6 domain protein
MNTPATLMNKLAEVLAKRKEYTVEGMLNKNKIAQDARSYSPNLINLLLADAELKGRFFTEAEEAGVLVFKKDIFLQFILNKQFLPDSYTKYKIKIGLGAEDGTSLAENQNVVLNFPYKDCVLEGGQDKEDQKRSEVFFNEVLAPDQITRLLDDKVFTNWKRYDKDGEKPLDELKEDDNLIIKGNNLVVLHSLEKRYAGKVKLIYIDPPYNTGSDSFGYNDNFRHSTWLVFMKNRLEIARKLLREDGTIFISLDDSESHYAKVLADEIFGRENFLADISYQRSGAAGLGQGGKFVINTSESILAFAKDKSLLETYDMDGGVPLELKHMKRYNNILVDEGVRDLVEEFPAKSNGEMVRLYKHRDYTIKTITLRDAENRKDDILEEYVENFDKIYRLNIPQIENQFQHNLISKMDNDSLYSVDYVASRGRNKGIEVTNYYNKKQLFAWLKSSAILDGDTIQKTNKLTDFWTHGDIPKADLANEGRVTLSRGKKPEQLLKRIISMVTKEGDIVLDYHLGSGTTAAVAHKMGRQYIGIEQLDYGDNDSTVRLQNVINGDQTGISKSVNWQGGGDFVYCELMNTVNEYRERVKQATDDAELMSLLDEASKSSFISYRVDPDELHPDEFSKLSRADKQRALLELIDNNTLYMNYEDINDPSFGVSEKDKEFNKKLYQKES